MAQLKVLKIIMALNLIICVTVLLSTTPASSDTPYQYLLFSQQWPKSVCSNVNCTNTPPSYFTVHGLWPSNYSVFELKCSGAAFNETLMNQSAALKANLNRSWPDVERGQNMRFWRYEWNKHGQCSDNVFSQTQYFQWCHNSWETQVIGGMLQRASITPRAEKYPLTDIQSAIKSTTNYDPLIRCPKSRKDLLLEVVICFDHDGTKIVDCGRKTDNCDAKVLYPIPTN